MSMIWALVWSSFVGSLSFANSVELANRLFENPKVGCSQLSDKFCDILWNSRNEGNIYLSPWSKILIGHTSKSTMSNIEWINIDALLASEPRLPADLQAKVREPMAELRRVMANENPSLEWKLSARELIDKINNRILIVARARAERKHPELKLIKDPDDRTEPQSIQYAEELTDLENQVVEAKWANHPHWLRVKDLYALVKKDLTVAVAGLNIPQSEKTRIAQVLKSIKLVLPYADPRIYGGDADCGSTTVNAFYEGSHNTFSICAGLFNGYQHDPSLYQVIAHEISHAFDPSASAEARYRETPQGQVGAKMCHASSPAYSCEQWQQLKSTVFARAKAIPEPNPPMRKLTECLMPVKELQPFDFEALKTEAVRSAGESMSSYATANSFTFLAQPTYKKHGKLVTNEYYRRPDLIEAWYNSHLLDNSICVRPTLTQLFNQILSCEQVDKKPADFSKLTPKDRDLLFKDALTQLTEIKASINEVWYSIIGRDGSELRSANMSRNSQEAFADWMARKAFEIRAKTVTNKDYLPRMVGEAGIFFCTSPSPLKDATDLTEIEKSWSYEEHPDNRPRRLTFFTPEIIRLIGCAPDDPIITEGPATCDL